MKLTFGISQTAGQIQSPVGSLAVTSTLPYLMVLEKLVMSLADWIGGRMAPVVEFDTLAQLASVRLEAVQRLD